MPGRCRGDASHLLILAAMAGNYLSNPEANTPEVSDVARSVLDAIGELAKPTLLVFRLDVWRVSCSCAV